MSAASASSQTHAPDGTVDWEAATYRAADEGSDAFPSYREIVEAARATPRQDWGLHTSTLLLEILEGWRDVSATTEPPPALTKGEYPKWDEIYAQCAPGVLFLVGEGATGTGFIIERNGYALTNHHVAAAGSFDRESRTWSLQAYRGELDEGRMNYRSEPIKATVFAWDPMRDLALLKIDTAGLGEKDLQPLELASSGGGSPRPGQDIALIGHAGIGLLWSMKPGHISAIGELSKSTPNALSMLHSLSKSSAERTPSHLEIVRNHMADIYRGWIGVDTRLIEATAVTSPGDSGGPLLNDRGEVVGIAMGLLSHQQTSTTAYYYIHLSEMHAFLEKNPTAPLLEIARDIWSSHAIHYSIGSLPGREGSSLLMGLDSARRPTLMALDLDASGESFSYRGEVPITSPVMGVHALDSGKGYVAAFFNGVVVGLDQDMSPVWHRETGSNIVCTDLSSDRSHGLLGLSSGAVLLFDTNTAEVSGSWALDGSPVHAVRFAPDSSTFWAASLEGMVRRMSVTGEVLTQAASTSTPVSIAVSPDATLLAIVGKSGEVTMHETSDMGSLWAKADLGAMQARFEPSGTALVVSPIDARTSLRWISAESGQTVHEVSFPASPYFFALSDDGSKVLASIEGGSHVLCETQSGAVLGNWSTFEAPEEPLMAVLGGNAPSAREFSLLSDEFVTGGRSGLIYRIDHLPAGKLTKHQTAIEGLDVTQVVRDQAFDAEFAMVLDYQLETVYALYDFDNDGWFELVRVDDDGDGAGDSQFEVGPKETNRSPLPTSEGLLLPQARLPQGWRAGYVAFVSGQR
jgi:S1-C subfamily serine protease